MIGVFIFTFIALIISIILVSISNKVEDKKDIKKEIVKLLPSYNCGACGFVNCTNMAENILIDKNNVLKCRPLKNKEEVVKKIEEILKD